MLQIKSYSTGEDMPVCVLQGKPSSLLITIFLPCLPDARCFSYHAACPLAFLSLFFLELFFDTLASVWMSLGMKNRSC